MSKKKLGLMIYVVHPKLLSKTQKNKWDIYEEVYIRNGVRNGLMAQSTIVLDCANMEVYKNRSERKDDFYTIVAYLAKSHQQVAEFKEVYDTFLDQMKKVEEDMQKASEGEEVENEDTIEKSEVISSETNSKNV